MCIRDRVRPTLVLPDPPVLTRLTQGLLDRDDGSIADPKDAATV